MTSEQSAADDFLDGFEETLPYYTTGELQRMVRTAQDWLDEDIVDWVDHGDNAVFEQYKEAIITELVDRKLEVDNG